MKFAAEREAMNAAFSACVRSIERRTQIPVLSHFMVEAKNKPVTIKATNLDMEVASNVPAEIETEGVGTLLAEPAQAFVARGKGDKVSLVWSDGEAHLRCARARLTVPTLDPTDFPWLRPREEIAGFTLPGPALRSAIESCLWAVGDDPHRAPAQCGIHVHRSDEGEDIQLRFAAVKGPAFFVSGCDLPLGAQLLDGFTIPAGAAAEIANLATTDCLISISQGYARFAFGLISLATKLIEDPFPDYRRISGHDLSALTLIDSDALADALDRIEIAADKLHRGTKVTIGLDSMTLERREIGRGHIVDEIHVEGSLPSPVTVGLNSLWLRSACRSFGSGPMALGLLQWQAGPVAVLRPVGKQIPVCGISTMGVPA